MQQTNTREEYYASKNPNPKPFFIDVTDETDINKRIRLMKKQRYMLDDQPRQIEIMDRARRHAKLMHKRRIEFWCYIAAYFIAVELTKLILG